MEAKTEVFVERQRNDQNSSDRFRVWQQIKAEPGIDTRSIIQNLGLSMQNVSARLSELEEEGRIQKSGKRYHIVKGRKTPYSEWLLVPEDQIEQAREYHSRRKYQKALQALYNNHRDKMDFLTAASIKCEIDRIQ
jgi:predicted transcriptional regulator